MDWEQNNKLIISEMLQKEIVPTEGELETLIRHMKLNALKQKKTNCTERKIIKKVQTQFIKIFPSVSLNHQYNRLTVLSEYILFLSKVIRVSSEYQEKLTNLLLLIKASKPKNHKNFTIRVNEDLSNGLLDEFMSIANYSNPNNPFQNIGIKKRNHLMFILLKELTYKHIFYSIIFIGVIIFNCYNFLRELKSRKYFLTVSGKSIKIYYENNEKENITTDNISQVRFYVIDSGRGIGNKNPTLQIFDIEEKILVEMTIKPIDYCLLKKYFEKYNVTIDNQYKEF